MAESLNPRRSWMVVPAHDKDAVKQSEDYEPDVVVLDLEYSVPPKSKEAARAGLGAVIKDISDRQIDTFVRIDRETRWADVRAAMHRGVKGILYPGPEDPQEVGEIADLIAAMERERGLDPGVTELALILESAKGFWNAVSIAEGSPRVTALGIGRIDLTMRLGPVPQDEFRLFRFLMTRTVVAARTLGKQPLGALWRPGSRGGVAAGTDTARAAREAGLMGFTGCICATPEQVASVNEGFAPA